MISLEEISKAKAELTQAVDDLALQVMVQGGAAVTAKALTALAALAEACEYADLAKEAKTAKPAKGKPLTEEAARDLIARLQSMLARPTEKQLERAESPAAESSAFAFEEDPE